MQVAMSLRAKGRGGLAARAGTILSRFGATAAKMERCLTEYVELTGTYHARPTFPITACVLKRHPALMRRYAHRGVEFAIHGLIHNDHAVLNLRDQVCSIAQAAAIFEDAGVPAAGFRAPYLRYNQATGDAVRSLGLRYHSSQAVDFAVLPASVLRDPQAAAYERALTFYSAQDAVRTVVRPRNRGGLIDIPVAVPDDEIMVDRLHLDDHAQSSAWLAMLDITCRRGELFTVQLHPERFHDCARALDALLAEARRRPEVWIARLDEVAGWWLRRGQTTVTVESLGDRRFRVAVDGDREAALLVKGMPQVEGDPWYGCTRVSRARCFVAETVVKPVVGASRRTPAAALDFLREEGYAVEVSHDRDGFGAYVDVAEATVDEAALLAEVEHAPGPLVRLARWPAGARSALAVTGDIDSITLQDFAWRLWETR